MFETFPTCNPLSLFNLKLRLQWNYEAPHCSGCMCPGSFESRSLRGSPHAALGTAGFHHVNQPCATTLKCHLKSLYLIRNVKSNTFSLFMVMWFCLLICDSSTSSWDVLPSNRPAPMPRSPLKTLTLNWFLTTSLCHNHPFIVTHPLGLDFNTSLRVLVLKQVTGK